MLLSGEKDIVGQAQTGTGKTQLSACLSLKTSAKVPDMFRRLS